MPETARVSRREARLLQERGSTPLMKNLGRAYLRLADRGEIELKREMEGGNA